MKGFFTGSTMQLISNIFLSIFLLLICYFLVYAEVLNNVFFLILFILIVVSVISLNLDFLTRRIVISEEGVKFYSLTKKFALKWVEIKFVEFRDIPIFRNTKEFLVFSVDHLPARELRKTAEPNEYIAVENKGKNVLREVKRYWRGPLVGAEHIPYPED